MHSPAPDHWFPVELQVKRYGCESILHRIGRDETKIEKPPFRGGRALENLRLTETIAEFCRGLRQTLTLPLR